MSTPVLTARVLSKRFGRFQAVSEVDFTLRPGETVALLGENGAGKSTLLKMLAGLERPSGGRIELDGAPVAWRSRAAARAAGIGFVPQHLSVIPELTVRENVWMTLPRGSTARDAEAAIARFAPSLDPARRAESMSLGERQAIEFVRVLAAGARVLLLDEPTAVLSPPECDDLFHRIDGLREAGHAIVLVTHKIADVERCADRAVVMRGGRTAGEFPPPFDTTALVQAAVGERPKEPQTSPLQADGSAPVVLHWEGRLRESAEPAALSLRSGEILALVGVDGNGQRELAESLLGLGKHGETLASAAPRAFIPQDRHREGLVLGWPLRENLRIGQPGADGLGWNEVQDLLARFDVRPAQADAPAWSLSGGNQQKLIIAREFGFAPPAWVLAFNPSHGLDFRATAQLHEQLRDAARRGAGVLLITMDLDEALALGSRFGVFYRGNLRIDGGYQPDRARLGRMMLGEAG